MRVFLCYHIVTADNEHEVLMNFNEDNLIIADVTDTSIALADVLSDIGEAVQELEGEG